MKRFIAVLLCVILTAFSGCGTIENKTPKKKTEVTEAEEIRAIWISIYDMAEFKGMSEGGFSDKADNMFRDISSRGFRDVFIQVRPCSDAVYQSDIFPWSKYISGEQGKSPGYDPFAIFLKIAHAYNLKVHAWINPYRISGTSQDMNDLSDNHPAKRIYEENENDIYFCTNGIYYNPASIKVQKLILDGVREIVEKYDVDGVHIDDFFYPTTDEGIDKNEYDEYRKNSGTATLADFRREQVNAFVAGMYSAAKNKDENIIVSISPASDIEKNINTHYADVKLWAGEDGYCDWIIPQIYYGFENETMPYKEVLEKWCGIVTNENIKLVIGLGSYKCGESDLYAGNGKDEWLNNTDILAKQLSLLREKGCDGFSVFSYNSLALPNETAEKEWKNFKEEMNKITSSL